MERPTIPTIGGQVVIGWAIIKRQSTFDGEPVRYVEALPITASDPSIDIDPAAVLWDGDELVSIIAAAPGSSCAMVKPDKADRKGLAIVERIHE